MADYTVPVGAPVIIDQTMVLLVGESVIVGRVKIPKGSLPLAGASEETGRTVIPVEVLSDGSDETGPIVILVEVLTGGSPEIGMTEDEFIVIG